MFKIYGSFLKKNVLLAVGNVYNHIVALRRSRPVARYVTCPVGCSVLVIKCAVHTT